jgi:hypothetical protein
MDVLQLKVPLGSKVSHYLQKNGWIVDEDGNPFIIRYVYQGMETADITAYSPHHGFNKRVTRPYQGDEILTATGSADAVTKAFIRDAAPEAGNRSLGITCAADQPGTEITDQTRRKLLGDEVIRVLAVANRGERFAWNNGNITFDTYAGLDRTKGNTGGNAECVFAARLRNIENESYEVDATSEVTTIFAAGAGEDTAREVHVEGDALAGWNRSEGFVDARDVQAGDVATLTQRALQALADTNVTIKATARDGVNLTYGRDYNVGDLVTVQVPYLTYEADGAFYKPVTRILSLNLQITQVIVTYENDDINVDVSFGTAVAARQITASTGARLSQLEANSGGGGGVTAHNLLSGLNQDDHTQYLTALRHSSAEHTKAMVGLENVTNNAQVKKIPVSVDKNIMIWSGTTGDTPADSGVQLTDFLYDGDGKLLWSGSWAKDGVITVPEVHDFMMLRADLATSTVGVFILWWSNTILFGAMNYKTAAEAFTVHFEATVSGNDLTLIGAGRIGHAASGSHSSWTERNVIALYGLIPRITL